MGRTRRRAGRGAARAQPPLCSTRRPRLSSDGHRIRARCSADKRYSSTTQQLPHAFPGSDSRAPPSSSFQSRCDHGWGGATRDEGTRRRARTTSEEQPHQLGLRILRRWTPPRL